MTVQTTKNQSLLIRDQVLSLLLQPLEAASVVLSAGPRMFDSSEPIRIPTLTGVMHPQWVGEGMPIPETDARFGELRLMPSDRASIKTLTKFTNELARQAAVQLDVVLRDRLVHDVSTKLDNALLAGTGEAVESIDGTQYAITGLLNQPAAKQAPLDLSTADTFLDALAVTAAAEVTPNRWFLSGEDFFTVRKLKDSSGRYLLESDITAGTTYRLFGVPVTVTNKLPKGKAILADMSSVAVVRDLAPSVKLLDQTYADRDEQAIRVVTRYDLGLLRPEGVVVLTAAA